MTHSVCHESKRVIMSYAESSGPAPWALRESCRISSKFTSLPTWQIETGALLFPAVDYKTSKYYAIELQNTIAEEIKSLNNFNRISISSAIMVRSRIGKEGISTKQFAKSFDSELEKLSSHCESRI